MELYNPNRTDVRIPSASIRSAPPSKVRIFDYFVSLEVIGPLAGLCGDQEWHLLIRRFGQLRDKRLDSQEYR